MRPPQPLFTRFSNLKIAAWYWFWPGDWRIRMLSNCGNGRSSCARCTVGLVDREALAGRQAEERVGHLFVSAGAEREVLRPAPG